MVFMQAVNIIVTQQICVINTAFGIITYFTY